MKKYKIFMMVAEASGDLIGADIMRNIVNNIPKDTTVEFVGITGSQMRQHHVKTIIDIKELSIIGLIAIILNIKKLVKIRNKTVVAIKDELPDMVISVDAFTFCANVVKKFRKDHKDLANNIKFLHVVAPSVWAYKENRAKIAASLFDHLFTFLPFENRYFTKFNLPTTFVGYPAVYHNKLDQQQKINIRKQFVIDKKKKIILFTPGSRDAEVKYLLPIYLEVIKELLTKHNQFHIIILTLKHLSDQIHDQTQIFCKKQKLSMKENINIIDDVLIKDSILKQIDFAVAKSGTNAMEIASVKKPMIVCYKGNRITYIIYKFWLNIKYVNIINIMSNKCLIPELIQDECTNERIINRILEHFAAPYIFKEKLAEINDIIGQLENKEKKHPLLKISLHVIDEISANKKVRDSKKI